MNPRQNRYDDAEIIAAYEQAGSIKGTCEIVGCSPKTARARLDKAGVRQRGGATLIRADADADNAPPSSGIRLTNRRISSQKPPPSEGVKRKIYELPKGIGFPVDDLEIKWGVSADTIKKKARQYDAFRYVERGPGDWVPCIIHPDTNTEG